MEKRVFLFSIYDSKEVRNEFFHFPFSSHFHESKLAHGPLGPKHGHYMDMSEGMTDIFTERRINLIDVRYICFAPMTTTNRESHRSPSTKNTQQTQEEHTNRKHDLTRFGLNAYVLGAIKWRD